MELGIYTFGDHNPNPVTGDSVTPKDKLRHTAELARQFDFGGVPLQNVRRSVEILGTEVQPEIRKAFPMRRAR